MKRKKHFISPRVLGQVELCLEGDLLVIGPSTQDVTTITSMGIAEDNFDFSEGNTDGYYVEWD